MKRVTGIVAAAALVVCFAALGCEKGGQQGGQAPAPGQAPSSAPTTTPTSPGPAGK